MNARIKAWVVDDDHSLRWVLEQALGQSGIDTRSFETADSVLDALGSETPDVLMTDVRMPGKEGLLHVSELDYGYVENVEDYLQVGDKIKVQLIEVRDDGKLRFSRKPFLEKPEGYVEPERKSRGGGRGDRRGGGRGDRRGGGRGGDRRGGRDGGRGGDRR